MQLGTVRDIFRYPVKAMAGEALDEAEVGWHGIDGDRRHAFVQSDDRSDFPWLTIRQVPALTRYVPQDGQVRTPGGRLLDLDGPELAAELADAHGGPVHLHRDARGLFDAFPVSFMSVQAVERIGAITGRELEPLRFRPTIVLDVPGREFPEDDLVGRTVSVGAELQVRVDVRDSRCMVVNFDPRTAERDPSVLRAVVAHRDKCLGVYGTTVRPGRVRVGDPIAVAA
jgi:uncharacterized protein YcbX